MSALIPKNILLGVTGGIAAYKAPDLVRRLRERGADVQVVMSRGAQQFITPMTFQAVSGRPVRTDLWDEAAEGSMGHIELARWADLVLIAPATADTISKLSAGLAGDLLSTVCLATEAPLVLAPAMNRQMWANPATQANVEKLRARGVQVLGPGEGDQACGETGAGRMLEPQDIASAVMGMTGEPGPLAGRSVMITAGPTREPIDPVRYITNRSSGKMGFALAEMAARMGAVVTLVSGPVHLSTPSGVRRLEVETAGQMLDAVHGNLKGVNIFIGAAAVSDYRVATQAEHKIKKVRDSMSLELVRNPDILASVSALPAGQRPYTVGFAAETEKLEEYARGKLGSKNLDMIAANLVGQGQGFDQDDNTLTAYWADGEQSLGSGSKIDLARLLLKLIASRLRSVDV
ncbi:MAG: bifunctional phosphopantothenoylcysteine decarboxylase/phosphopantothenate--cysteine ligase CoaBC [Gammaproteobacteria bacterium]|nr:bifunctional phosphopantothenoylcysteine decarboxylase/phosphopantothenate--cysteine ligase CoaBC [Gammaproteobacteria bacterium]